MKIISSALLFFLFAAALAQESPTTTEASNTTTETSNTTTDSTTITTLETTTLQTTTTSDETTSTVIPTTSSSTTISSTSSSTTEAPTSSPVTPTKSPEPKPCQFNATCIKAELQADFVIDYEGEMYPQVLGCDASYSRSDCSSNETQTLVLSESNYTLTMVFEKLAGKIFVKNVTFNYAFPGGPRGSVSNNTELFQVNAGNSYLCKSNIDVHFENVTMNIREVHIQAFLEEGKAFGATQECPADDKVGDIVPIAVGIALATLIIIVLIAYLVGRRRSRQKGYQSV